MSEKTLLATRRDETVETIHGVAVADPYRWLEDGESEEPRAWTAAQNARTEALLVAFRAGPRWRHGYASSCPSAP